MYNTNDQEWYPESLKFVKDFDPVTGEEITLSMITTNSDSLGNIDIEFHTLLIDSEDIKFISPNEIDVSGKNYEPDTNFTTFFLSKKLKEKPISGVVSIWESSNNIVFRVNSDFLMHYGLIPRSTNKYLAYDHISRPEYDIIKNCLVSQYDFPIYSPSSVVCKKEYLTDYAHHLNKEIIQIYNYKRIIDKSDFQENELLEKDGHIVIDNRNNHFRIIKLSSGKIYIEVSGYRRIEVDIQESINLNFGLKPILEWPDGVQYDMSKRTLFRQSIFISDEVLKRYETKINFSINPETGSVSYKNQWSIIRTNRVGRNYLEVNLFSLYEGVPNAEIIHWHKYATSQSQVDSSRLNIALRAKKIVFSYLRLWEEIRMRINYIQNELINLKKIIKFDRNEIEDLYWPNIDVIKPLTRVVSKEMSKEEFLSRQKELNSFFSESLSVKHLREIIKKLDIDASKIYNDGLRVGTLKLFHLILGYFKIAEREGFDILEERGLILDCMYEEGLPDSELLKILFSIYNLRQLDAHQFQDAKKMERSFGVLGIDISIINDSYSEINDYVYDQLHECLKNNLEDL